MNLTNRKYLFLVIFSFLIKSSDIFSIIYNFSDHNDVEILDLKFIKNDGLVVQLGDHELAFIDLRNNLINYHKEVRLIRNFFISPNGGSLFINLDNKKRERSVNIYDINLSRSGYSLNIYNSVHVYLAKFLAFSNSDKNLALLETSTGIRLFYLSRLNNNFETYDIFLPYNSKVKDAYIAEFKSQDLIVLETKRKEFKFWSINQNYCESFNTSNKEYLINSTRNHKSNLEIKIENSEQNNSYILNINNQITAQRSKIIFNSAIAYVEHSFDFKYLFVITEDSLEVLDCRDLKTVSSTPIDNPITYITYSSKKEIIAYTTLSSDHINFVNCENPLRKYDPFKFQFSINYVKFSPDGKFLVAYNDKKIQVIDTDPIFLDRINEVPLEQIKIAKKRKLNSLGIVS